MSMMSYFLHYPFFNNFWNSSKAKMVSLRSAFKNSDMLMKAAERIKVSGKKFTERRFLRELTKVGASVPSVFKPQVARMIYHKYDVKSILDPCMGWGGRLTASTELCRYIGRDINKKSVLGNKRLAEWISSHNDIDVDLSVGDLLINLEWSGKVDMIFTSPPFGSFEKYSGYEGLVDFNNYVEALFKAGEKFLYNGGYLAIHSPSGLDTKSGFDKIDTIELQSRNSFTSRNKTEFVVVFRRNC